MSSTSESNQPASTTRLSPRDSANFIVAAIAKDKKPLITIDEGAVRKVAEMILDEITSSNAAKGPKPWEFAAQEVLPTFYPYPEEVEEILKPCFKRNVLNWIFFMDTINFSFWTDKARGEAPFEITLGSGQTYTGYYAACAWLNGQAITGWPITEAYNMASLSEERLLEDEREWCDDEELSIVKKIPMLKERIEALNEAGEVLMEKFSKSLAPTDYGSGTTGELSENFHHLRDLDFPVGGFINCVAQCGRSAQRLVELVVEHFPSYRDYAEFRHQPVSFLKRAQILAADVNSYLRAAGDPGVFTDMDTLTMFPDYRVPQILAHLGVLNYSQELMAKFAADELWEYGCEVEVVLRAFSIRACDLITAEVNRLLDEKDEKKGKGVAKDGDSSTRQKFTAAEVDMFLWVLRRKLAAEIEQAGVPFHRIRCIYY